MMEADCPYDCNVVLNLLCNMSELATSGAHCTDTMNCVSYLVHAMLGLLLVLIVQVIILTSCLFCCYRCNKRPRKKGSYNLATNPSKAKGDLELTELKIPPPPKEADPVHEYQISLTPTDPRTSSDYATVKDAIVAASSPTLSPPEVPLMARVPKIAPMPEYATLEDTKKAKGDDFTTAQLKTNFSMVPSLATDYEEPISQCKRLSIQADTTPMTHDV